MVMLGSYDTSNIVLFCCELHRPLQSCCELVTVAVKFHLECREFTF